MNIFVGCMLVFALAGFLDLLTGGKRGYGKDFMDGMLNMGGLAMSCVGFYAIGIAFVTRHAEAVTALASGLPFEPSLLIGSLLAPDMGAFAISREITKDAALSVFIGALVAGGMGQTMGYQLPVFLASVKAEEIPELMQGFVFGLIALPAGLLAGGLLLGLSLKTLLLHMIPVMALCVILIGAYSAAPALTMRVMTLLGKVIRVFSYVLFALAVAGIFFPTMALAEEALVSEMLYLILRMCIVASGGLVLSHMVLKHFGGAIGRVGRWLGINEKAVMGLVLSLVQSLAMLPLFSEMDRRGRILNAAFSVSGAYVLGGQMAFISSLVTGPQNAAYMVSKLVSGTAGVILAAVLSYKAVSGIYGKEKPSKEGKSW